MYKDKEAEFNVVVACIANHLAKSTSCDDEIAALFAQVKARKVTVEQFASRMKAKAEEVNAGMKAVMKTFEQRCCRLDALLLRDLSQEQASALRDAMREVAALFNSRWNGIFLERIINPFPIGEWVPFNLGEDSCPDILVVDLQSNTIEGSEGERTCSLYGQMNINEVLAKMAETLCSPKRGPWFSIPQA